MGKKSGPAAPAPPDPVATANAQAQANTTAAITQANLNRVNQFTPQGSLIWSQQGTNSDGTPMWASHQTYSPQQQALYDQQTQIAMALSGLAGNNINRVNDAQSQLFNFDGMTPMRTGVAGGLPSYNYGYGPMQLQTQLGDSGDIRQTFDQGRGVSFMQDGAGGDIQRTFGEVDPLRTVNGRVGSDIQRSLNYSNLTALPGTSDFGAEARRASDAVYDQLASRLNPQFRQQENDMEARLAAQGISQNSDAYRRSVDNFGRTRNDAYSNAALQAVQAGGAEQSRLFGLALASRQQGQNEADMQGQFGNNAQAQIFQQALQRAQQFNQTQAQQFGQNQSRAGFANNAQQQAYQQIAQSLGMNNQAAGQQYAQNQGAASFWNSGQDQRFTQGLGAAEFGNNAWNTMFQQGQQAAATNNQARAQAYNEQVSDVNMNNTARQQQIQEASYLRNLPLNEIAALLGTGGGVTNPNFAPVSQVGVAAPDYQGAVYQNYQGAMQQYNAQQQARSQGLGSIFGLLGSLGSAAIMSDRRLKENMQRVMTDAKGLVWYTYNYIGEAAKRYGVMAQDVEQLYPNVVVTMPSGYKAVKYGELYSV